MIVAVGLHGRDIADPGAAGLREDRRRIADKAEIDAPDIDGLQQRRAELEVDPLDLDAERLEGAFERLTLANRREEAALLRTDADFDRLVLSACLCGQGGREQKRRCENVSSIDHDVALSVGSVGEKLGIRAPASFGEHRTGSTLGFARRAELATFETVEQPLGGEETEAARVSRDDAGGAVVDFDDVGVGLLLGHDCSLAGVSAFLSCDLLREVL
ncbi:hypothetical protein ACVW0I_008086 [Bradyrhizobium sp. LM6.11]